MIFEGPKGEVYVLMGQGQVAVRAAGSPVGARIGFRPCKAAPVGAPLQQDDVEEERVALLFENVESVDVMMRALTIARERIEAKGAAAAEPNQLPDLGSPGAR